MGLVDTGSVSECSITTATDNPSVGNPIIPRGRTPIELLVALPKDGLLNIWDRQLRGICF